MRPLGGVCQPQAPGPWIEKTRVTVGFASAVMTRLMPPGQTTI